VVRTLSLHFFFEFIDSFPVFSSTYPIFLSFLWHQSPTSFYLYAAVSLYCFCVLCLGEPPLGRYSPLRIFFTPFSFFPFLSFPESCSLFPARTSLTPFPSFRGMNSQVIHFFRQVKFVPSNCCLLTRKFRSETRNFCVHPFPPFLSWLSNPFSKRIPYPGVSSLVVSSMNDFFMFLVSPILMSFFFLGH